MGWLISTLLYLDLPFCDTHCRLLYIERSQCRSENYEHNDVQRTIQYERMRWIWDRIDKVRYILSWLSDILQGFIETDLDGAGSGTFHSPLLRLGAKLNGGLPILSHIFKYQIMMLSGISVILPTTQQLPLNDQDCSHPNQAHWWRSAFLTELWQVFELVELSQSLNITSKWRVK